VIFIYFCPGSFGTTIEYSIKRFTKEFESVNANILDDGSMHLYEKECHPCTADDLKSIKDSTWKRVTNSWVKFNSNTRIVTPIYPGTYPEPNSHKNLPINKIINEFKKILTPEDKVIFITHKDNRSVARNELICYQKINAYIDEITEIDGIQRWNKNYKSFNDMQRWEKREYLSLSYHSSLATILNAKNYSNVNWLTITADDILFDFTETIKRIISYLDLTFVDTGLNGFAVQWKEKQQYMLDQYDIVENIVNSTITDQEFSWGELNIVAEALIQYKLRVAGFDLQCYDLNAFPTNNSQLVSLLK
jgi:hypothetical protein